MQRSLLLSLIAFVVWTAPIGAQTISPEILSYPDMILHNGKVVTMDDKSNSDGFGNRCRGCCRQRWETFSPRKQ